MCLVGLGVAAKAAFSVSSCFALMVVRGPLRFVPPGVFSSFAPPEFIVSLLLLPLTLEFELALVPFGGPELEPEWRWVRGGLLVEGAPLSLSTLESRSLRALSPSGPKPSPRSSRSLPSEGELAVKIPADNKFSVTHKKLHVQNNFNEFHFQMFKRKISFNLKTSLIEIHNCRIFFILSTLFPNKNIHLMKYISI